jgi:tRNA (adenine22-N1)-methyltransferase
MTLSKRLLAVAEMIPEGAKIADVGSDHAQLPLFLLEEKRIQSAEAIENKPGPYARMAKAVRSSVYSEQVSLSLSDGISSLAEEVDTVVLAGMGGRLILRILKDHPEKLAQVKTIVVDAHNERPLLIAEMGALSYRLVRAKFFYDEGIAYDVMRFDKNIAPIVYSSEECLFGPTHLKEDPGPDFHAYWSKEESRYEGLLKNEQLSPKARNDYETLVKAIQEVLHEH